MADAHKPVPPDADDRQLEIVRLSDLRADTIYQRWEGGEAIGRMSRPRRETFLANPLSRGDDDAVQAIVTIENRAVARFDMFMGEVTVGGERNTVMWGSDLFVDPAFRKRGLGLMVSKGLEDIHPVAAVCGVSARSRPIFWKLEWTDFQMPRHLAIRRSRPIVEKYLRIPALAAVAATVVDAGMTAHRSVARTRRRSGLTLENLSSMPAEFNDLLAPRSDHVTPHRSAEWINWLMTHAFEGDPNQKRALFLLKDDSGEPAAYFLTKSRFYDEASQHQIRDITIGSLLDWRIFDERRVTSFDVAMYAMETLVAGGVDAVEICMPDPEASQRLAQLGFPRVGSLNFMFKADPESPLAAPQFCHPERWLIRPAEGDNAFT
jgi:GNAT superfamily N-acetyltransferase